MEDFKLENIGQTTFGNGDVGQWGEEVGEAMEAEEQEEEEEEAARRLEREGRRKEKGIAAQNQRHTGGQFGRYGVCVCACACVCACVCAC